MHFLHGTTTGRPLRHPVGETIPLASASDLEGGSTYRVLRNGNSWECGDHKAEGRLEAGTGLGSNLDKTKFPDPEWRSMFFPSQCGQR